MTGVKAWAVVTAFWGFVALLYDGQILWLSRVPGEKIDLRAAFAWQTTYYLLWIPLTLLVWRLTAGWIPDAPRDWPRIIARHVPLVAAVVAGALHRAWRRCRRCSASSMVPGFWPSVVGQMRGRLHLELLIYTAVAGTGAAIVLHERYRDRQLAGGAARGGAGGGAARRAAHAAAAALPLQQPAQHRLARPRRRHRRASCG